jgi:glycosyltransferase A (GT-A) superfamily protein (DUF2064 family)
VTEDGLRAVLMPAAGGRSQALEHELAGRARRWAQAFASGGVVTAPGGLGEAVSQLFADGDEPVLVVWPELARWRADHAAAALDDLADECEISVGPIFDGGFYLVAFARPVPALLELADDHWQTRDPIGLAVSAAGHSGRPVGLLRTERGLRTPADVSALLADPLVDDELRTLLS